MEFRFRAFKKAEFESALVKLRIDHNIGAGAVATYNNDGEFVTAIIPDEVISEFTDEEVNELRAI